MPVYVPRIADQRLGELFAGLPAVMITGPRSTGKTTTAENLAKSIVSLDRPAESGLFRADPDAALASYEEPLLLDEWQAVPEVLGAVKRSIDKDFRPGRFLLTGSVRADLEREQWPGTGRIVRLPMYGLTVRELLRNTTGEHFLTRLAALDVGGFGTPDEVPDIGGYVQLALRGGFPEPALGLLPGLRAAWLDSYLDEMFTRDARLVGVGRDPVRLRRYFEAIAVNTAGVVDDKTIYDAAGVDRKTALAYERLLMNLFVLDELPPWSHNRLTRMVKTPKRHVVDTSLAASMLNLDEKSLLHDSDLVGRIIESFVVAQIRPELTLETSRQRLFHLRNKEGRNEIDLVIEKSAREVFGIEVKATAAPTSHDARHLIWLRNTLGEQFVAGAVMHTGPRPFVLSDRILALPICTLWG